MGQKVHPIGFRLGISASHKSKWYATFSNYPKNLQIDSELRASWQNLLKELAKDQMNEMSDRHTLILSHSPTQKQITLTIYTVNPKLLIADLMDKNRLKTKIRGKDKNKAKKIGKTRYIKESFYPLALSEFLTKQFDEYDFILNIRRIKSPLTQSGLLAQSLAKKLEKRMPFRRAVRKVFDDFKKGSKQARLNPRQKGLKVQVGGRLNGAEIARTEWVRQGKVPLHTLQTKVDYVTERAETIYGTLGIKIWLCKG